MAAPRAYYNDTDQAAADILLQLIADDVIAPGDVDTRSIKDVSPDDLDGYTQCHFFAGGGLWSVAARLAGWPDQLPLWTGSCPCQGESVAGKRRGADDPRHLWPDFYRLIRARRPPVIVGEQVARAAGTHWLDRVCSDLEDENYAARSVDIPACAVDAPQQRQRLWWVAMEHTKSERRREGRPEHELWRWRDAPAGADGELCDLLDEWLVRERKEPFSEFVASEGLLQPDPYSRGRDRGKEIPFGQAEKRAVIERPDGVLRNGSWWSGSEWIVSPIDGKARRTKPGLSFMVDGLPGRVDLWRVAGNAISPVLAAEVLAALLDTLPLYDLALTTTQHGGSDA